MPSGIAKDPARKVAKFLATAKERGSRMGVLPQYVMKGKYCVVCGVWFEFKFYPHNPSRNGLRKACGNACSRKLAGEARRKVPNDFELLTRLYWDENMSTEEIAEMFSTDHSTVRRRMVRLGIPSRPPGHSRNVVCYVEGCNEPVYKVKHSSSKSYYGRRCRSHWDEHRNKMGRNYRRRPEVKERMRRERVRWYYLGANNIEGEKSWLHESKRLLRSAKRLLINPGE